jgi:Inner membrane protein YgaP-like, transmembrane domain
MIERNLGNVERVTRLLLGIAFAVWALVQPTMNGIEWFVVAVSLALIVNGIFSRCYFWYLLDIDTSGSKKNHETAATTIC